MIPQQEKHRNHMPDHAIDPLLFILKETSSLWLCTHLTPSGPSQAEEQVEVVADEPGFGQHAVRQGDLVLVHYTG